MEDAPKKFFRLQPGGEVRLRYGYIIRCVDLRKDASGRVTEVHCTYDPETRSGIERRRAQGEGHDSLGQRGARGAGAKSGSTTGCSALRGRTAQDADFKTFLNPESLRVEPEARLEPSLATAAPGAVVQFERLGYFVADRVDHRAGQPVFNRVVTLRDSWAKLEV